MNIAICANDKTFINQVSKLLNDIMSQMVSEANVSCLENGAQLEEALSQRKYDIVYLDMQIESDKVQTLGKMVRQHAPKCFIIYITTDPRCIEDIFFHDPQAYLKNPISRMTFEDFFRKARANMEINHVFFECRINHRSERINVSEIIYFESNSKKILIHMTGNKMIEFYGKLDDVEQYVLNELNCECFVRKHKSFFINNNHIYRSTKRSMTLLNGQTLPISRTYQNSSL